MTNKALWEIPEDRQNDVFIDFFARACSNGLSKALSREMKSIGSEFYVRRFRAISQSHGSRIDLIYWLDGEYLNDSLYMIQSFLATIADMPSCFDIRFIEYMAALLNILNVDAIQFISVYKEVESKDVVFNIRFPGVSDETACQALYYLQMEPAAKPKCHRDASGLMPGFKFDYMNYRIEFSHPPVEPPEGFIEMLAQPSYSEQGGMSLEFVGSSNVQHRT